MCASLFLLCLLTVLVVPANANECLGLGSHIEGVLSGMRLLPGLRWPWLVLPDRWRRIASACGIQGAFVNWVAMRVVAMLAAGAMLTVAAQGFPLSDVGGSFVPQEGSTVGDGPDVTPDRFERPVVPVVGVVNFG